MFWRSIKCRSKKNTAKTEEKETVNLDENKEIKVIRINAKTLIITSFITSAVSLISLTSVEYIKKPSEPQNKFDEREINYFESSAAKSEEQFKNNEIGLNKAEEKVDSILSVEKDEQLKNKYGRVKSYIQKSIETSRINQKAFRHHAKNSIDAIKNGERVNAAALRKTAR